MQYRLDNPLERETTLGPMVRTDAADSVRAQIREAVAVLLEEERVVANAPTDLAAVARHLGRFLPGAR